MIYIILFSILKSTRIARKQRRRSRKTPMSIDWNAFTPWSALLGGVLIGVAAAMLVLLNGRIAGISGIVGGLLRPARGDIGWRLAFLAGLIGAPLAYALFQALPTVQIDAGNGTLLAAGLLVGVGTRYGAGCTSGHGVCGLSRLSPRSAVATAMFMAAGFATVFVLRHLLAA
ncbi:YeeE/YedE family protein [Janthinobacterium fluminis]|uniref:YeeE/YedE family protein n=1 Tax=Janthinobacterium fluminis TaxID=2987524 RepID=A0ABT5K8V1_9BURK|nr:YeeE/YedE family protein [Janthinobacterium fluminis]MDC8760915.1 YeeE/YedE family protein [Janthinobacterium fluminis]